MPQKNNLYNVSITGGDQYDMPIYSRKVEDVKEEIITDSSDSPYIETRVTVTAIFREYNPKYGDDKLCKCGHSYYRHFDSYEGMAPVGCKYCRCREFIPADKTENSEGDF